MSFWQDKVVMVTGGSSGLGRVIAEGFGAAGAKLALIYGSDELARDVVKLRDLGGRTERDVPRDQVLAAVRGFLAGP